MKTQVISLAFATFGNSNADKNIEITFNFDQSIVSWRNRIFKVNERLLTVKSVTVTNEYNNLETQHNISVISVENAMQLIIRTLRSFKHANKALDFLNGLVGTVLVSDWEIDDRDTTNYNLSAIQSETENTRDAQQVLRINNVVAFTIDSNNFVGNATWVEGCLETATKEWGFCLPDKTNKKRAVVGDAVVVSGRSVDGTKSLVHADKAEKQLNRESMLKHTAAELPVVHEDGLVSELHDGKFAVSYGLGDYSLLINDPLLSLAVGDAGIVNREPINYTANKLLRGGLNLELLFTGNPEYLTELEQRFKVLRVKRDRANQLKAVISDVKKELKALEDAETVLQPGSYVEFRGQVIISNYNTFPVRVHKVKSVRKGAYINTECRSLVVELHTKAEFNDYNAKLRGQWIKGMTTRNDDYIVNDSHGEAVEARFIMNHNSVKNEKAVSLRAWANNEGQRVAFTQSGELRHVEEDVNGKWKLGELVNLATVEAELAAISELYDVEQIVCVQDLNDFKASRPEAFNGVVETKVSDSSSTSEESSLVKLNYRAKGFVAPLIYAVELSSVPENLSVNRKLAPNASAYLTTFAPGATKKIQEHNNKLIKSLKLASSENVDARFNLDVECQAKALREILESAVKGNSRDLLKTLGDKYPSGFTVQGSVNGKRPWSVTIPARLLTVLSHFNQTGFSSDSKVTEVHAFLTVVADSNSCLHLLADYGFRLGASLKGWREDVNSRDKAFTKGSPMFRTHGLKVLANSQAGYEVNNDVEVPVIWINSNNPLAVGTIDKQGKKVKPIKDGDVVLFYRNPIVDLTPGVIRFNDKACGEFTCALSPSVLAWSSQTDNDGDTLWVVPMKQVTIDNVDGKRKEIISKAVADMMNHPLVGKVIATEAMASFKAGNLFAGIIKARSNFGDDMSKTIVNSNPDIIALAEAVANHYTVRVGQGYSIMFNAFNTFVNKFHGKGLDSISHAEIVAIKASSFVFYEEVGLAGYSASNETQFQNLTDSALERLGKRKVQSAGMFNGKNKKGNQNPWFYASLFRAQSIIQSHKERQQYLADIPLELNSTASQIIKLDALNNGLFRTLTKGHLNSDGMINDLITSFNSKTLYKDHPFADALCAWQEFVKDGLMR
ncbi:MAG: hypothetical protein AAFQ80_15180 [Cyanobacteria bacterium J06621_8]